MNNILKNNITKNANIAYIDFPLYGNVGDQYIFLGAASFLKDNGNKIQYASSLYGYSTKGAKKNINAETIILCGGGGNFGDLYRKHQNLRNKIVSDFPDNLIIFLPQSIHYKSDDYLSSDMSLLKKHKNLIIMARDEMSFDLLKGFQLNAILTPDTAHYLYNGYIKKHTPGKKCLYLLRKDKEATKEDDKYSDKKSVDWVDLLSYFDKKVCIRILKWMSKISRLFKINDFSYYPAIVYYKIVRFRIDHYILRYDKVITSRLHGYIIALLNDCEVETLDNSYGKIKKYKDFLMSVKLK